MFRKYFLILCLIPFLSSCFQIKEPVFKYVKIVSLKQIKGFDYALNANIVMHNPNGVGTKLIDSEIEIFVKKLKVGKVVLGEKRKIQRKKDFSIPIQITLNLKDFFKLENMNDVLSLIKKKKVDANFNGTVKFRIGLFNKTVQIDHNQELEF